MGHPCQPLCLDPPMSPSPWGSLLTLSPRGCTGLTRGVAASVMLPLTTTPWELWVTSLSESPFQIAVDGDFVIWTQNSSIDFKYVDRRSPGDVYTSFLQEPLARSFTLFGVIVINGNRRPGSGEGPTRMFRVADYPHAQCLLALMLCSVLSHSVAGALGYRECLEDSTGCSHFCEVSSDGMTSCSCPSGFVLDADQKRCGE